MRLGGHPFRDATDEILKWLGFTQVWLAVAFMGVALTATGAFDTYLIENVFLRALLFLVVVGGGSLCCVIVTGFVRGFTGRSAFENFDLTAKIGFASIPFGSFTGRYIHAYILDYEVPFSLILRSTIHGSFVVMAILVLMYFARFRAIIEARSAERKHVVAPIPQIPNYMESEDHYLKIVRESGVELVRANLGEVAAKFGTGGLRCHKSYWVAHEAIERRKRQGRQLLLVLKDGTEIPVGRSYEKEVRAALLMDGFLPANAAV